jgi:hypothetical protein
MGAADKIMESLTLFMEGYAELTSGIESDYAAEGEEEFDEAKSSEVALEVEAAIITEMRAALEAIMETEDFGTEEIAIAISSLSEALEEIDPDVFEASDDDEEESDEEVDEEYYEDDEDIDADIDEDEEYEDEDDDEDE